MDTLVAERRRPAVDAAGWRAIDAAEISRGSLGDRPRNKFTVVADMLAVAAAAAGTDPGAGWATGIRQVADRREPGMLAGKRGNLLHAHLAHRLTQRPVVVERIGDDAVAVAPELVLERGDHGGAGVECPLELGIDVGRTSDGS